MKIYAPYCSFCKCGLPLEECSRCTNWLNRNAGRLERYWDRRFRMWSYGWSVRSSAAEAAEAEAHGFYHYLTGPDW